MPNEKKPYNDVAQGEQRQTLVDGLSGAGTFDDGPLLLASFDDEPTLASIDEQLRSLFSDLFEYEHKNPSEEAKLARELVRVTRLVLLGATNDRTKKARIDLKSRTKSYLTASRETWEEHSIGECAILAKRGAERAVGSILGVFGKHYPRLTVEPSLLALPVAGFLAETWGRSWVAPLRREFQSRGEPDGPLPLSWAPRLAEDMEKIATTMKDRREGAATHWLSRGENIVASAFRAAGADGDVVDGLVLQPFRDARAGK